MLDGEQYIAVAQGSGGAVMLTLGEELKRNRTNQKLLLVFKLGNFSNTQSITRDSEPGRENLATILDLGHTANRDPETIKLGEALYSQNCASCHGISAKSNHIVPDLRYMSEQTHIDFIGIVLGGSYAHKGMIGFHGTLSLDDAEAIHSYLDKQQESLPDKVEMSFFEKIEYWIIYWLSKLGERYPELLNMTRKLMM